MQEDSGIAEIAFNGRHWMKPVIGHCDLSYIVKYQQDEIIKRDN